MFRVGPVASQTFCSKTPRNIVKNAVGSVTCRPLKVISHHENSEKVKAESTEVKPLSEMPRKERPWIVGLMNLVFAKGGFYKAFYKRHEEAVR